MEIILITLCCCWGIAPIFTLLGGLLQYFDNERDRKREEKRTGKKPPKELEDPWWYYHDYL